MTLSKRDKVLAVILPAFLIVIGYGWTVPGKHKELTAATAARDAAQQQMPPPLVLSAAEHEVANLTREIAKQQKEIETLKQHWDEAAAKCGSADLRNDRIKKLTTLLMQNRLTVLDDSEADVSKTGKLPAVMDQLAAQLAQANKNLKPQLRQLHLHGTYLDLHRVMQELSQGDVWAIPVGLSMKTGADGSSDHDWNLLVWI